MKEVEWYGEWEARFPKKVKKHNSRGLKALEYLRDPQLKVEGVVEYFGGTGNHSRQIQQVLHPEWHVVFDVSAEACVCLRGFRCP